MSEKQHIIYGDTDSVYLHLENYGKNHGIDMDVDMAVKVADNLQERLQEDLVGIIASKFSTPSENIAILEPGREVVGRKGLFKDKKKRYAIHVVDNEGKKADKLKIMGMDTQRSDTPKFIQKFLSDCIKQVVMMDAEYSQIKDIVDEFREIYRQMDPWRRGSPGRVKNLIRDTKKFERWQKQSHVVGAKKPTMHYMVKAAYNTNLLMEVHGETRWDRLRDGDKIEMIYLKDNPEGIDSVAIKTGEHYVPDWFMELPFDIDRMEKKLLDQKLHNVIGSILQWDFTPPKSVIDKIGKIMDDFYD